MTDLRVYRDNSEIYVWEWEAHYLDGTVLHQTENGLVHRIKDIEQWKLAEFKLCSVFPAVAPISLLWRPGRKLIYFTRVSFFNVGKENELTMRRYCLGYEDGDSKVILTIMPDGGIIVSQDGNIKIKVSEEK